MENSKKSSFLRKISIFLFSAAMFSILGAFGGGLKQASARPSCSCPNPDIEVVYHEPGFTRYHCNNCGWWYDYKR